MLHPCQQSMLTTRQDFPGDERVYTCEARKVACVVSGPGSDEEMVALVCGECCQIIKALGSP